MTQLRTILTQWKDALAAAQSAATILALIVGAFWAYFKVFKGRIYTRRLEPTISATIRSGQDYMCAIVKITVTNVGLARVDLDLNDSTISAKYYDKASYEPTFHNVIWSDLGTTDAFIHHAWVEPGEVVTEERLFALPIDLLIAAEFHLRLLSKPTYFFFFWRRPRTEWNALTVAYCDDAHSPAPLVPG